MHRLEGAQLQPEDFAELLVVINLKKNYFVEEGVGVIGTECLTRCAFRVVCVLSVSVLICLFGVFIFTKASCCLVKPPFRNSSNRLPTTGQLVGPGMLSRLCALDAACGQRAASAASFSPRTHTEDVGLKCCSPKDFFFSTSTIWGTFWICALIVETTRKKAFLRKEGREKKNKQIQVSALDSFSTP